MYCPCQTVNTDLALSVSLNVWRSLLSEKWCRAEIIWWSIESKYFYDWGSPDVLHLCLSADGRLWAPDLWCGTMRDYEVSVWHITVTPRSRSGCHPEICFSFHSTALEPLHVSTKCVLQLFSVRKLVLRRSSYTLCSWKWRVNPKGHDGALRERTNPQSARFNVSIKMPLASSAFVKFEH